MNITKVVVLVGLMSVAFNALAAQPTYMSCPRPDQFFKNTQMKWQTHTGWQTFAVSFSTGVHQFLGAQWQGVKLGNIYCLYQGDDMTFVIKAEYYALVQVPSGGKWSKNLGGYKNCYSHDLRQCLFIPLKKEKSGNIYEELDSLKTALPQQFD